MVTKFIHVVKDFKFTAFLLYKADYSADILGERQEQIKQKQKGSLSDSLPSSMKPVL